MQLLFIRHGESENNALWRADGSEYDRTQDPDLTELGRQQVEILAEFLAANRDEFPITHLYTSLMQRAIKTAYPLAEKLDLPLFAWPEIHEGGGIYLRDKETGENNGLPGNPRSYFETNFPALELPDWVSEAGWWNRPHEDRPERAIRAQTVLQELLRRHGDSQDKVAFVSHGGFFNYFVNAVMHKILHRQAGYWFEMKNVGITRIDFKEDRTVFAYLNRIDFLPRNMIS